MSERTKEILKACRALSLDEVAELADELNIILAEHPNLEIGLAWAEEIERRIAACDSGAAEAVTWEEIVQKLPGALRERAQS